MDTLFSPLVKAAIGSFIRTLLAGLGGYLVSTGVWEAGASDQYIEGITLALVGLLWSFWQKYRTHQTVLQALDAPSGTTLEELKGQG